MPDLIETRPFTIHPEIFAWPSFRLYSERVAWAYLALFAVIAFLLRTGMNVAWGMALVMAAAFVAIAIGFTFVKYKQRLQKPETREVFRNCVVSLSDDEVRQDFTDSSFMAIKLFAVRNFREIGDFYFIFSGPKNGIVVPKTSFESPEESISFASRLRQAARKK